MPEDIPAAAFTLARARPLLDEVRNPGAWCPIIPRQQASLSEMFGPVHTATSSSRGSRVFPIAPASGSACA